MKIKSMSNKWTVSLPTMIVCVVLALGASAVAQQAAASQGGVRCSTRTLSGDYGMRAEGTLLGPNWPLQTLVKIHFDGRGGLTALVYKVINGTPTYDDWTSEGSGTYIVNEDCTGSAIFNGPIPIHFIVVNNGKEFLGIVDGNSITVAGARVN
jgi:hypothetical protein